MFFLLGAAVSVWGGGAVGLAVVVPCDDISHFSTWVGGGVATREARGRIGGGLAVGSAHAPVVPCEDISTWVGEQQWGGKRNDLGVVWECGCCWLGY